MLAKEQRHHSAPSRVWKPPCRSPRMPPCSAPRPFADGCFEQQDAGSQLAAAALDVAPRRARHRRSAPDAGGKTSAPGRHDAGQGRLLAMDVEEWKLENPQQRARVPVPTTWETWVITSSKTVKRLKRERGSRAAGRALLWPGRALGATWMLHGATLLRASAGAGRPARRNSATLQPDGEGGRPALVYATCSILPEENRQQVGQVPRRHTRTSVCWSDHTVESGRHRLRRLLHGGAPRAYRLRTAHDLTARPRIKAQRAARNPQRIYTPPVPPLLFTLLTALVTNREQVLAVDMMNKKGFQWPLLHGTDGAFIRRQRRPVCAWRPLPDQGLQLAGLGTSRSMMSSQPPTSFRPRPTAAGRRASWRILGSSARMSGLCRMST